MLGKRKLRKWSNWTEHAQTTLIDWTVNAQTTLKITISTKDWAALTDCNAICNCGATGAYLLRKTRRQFSCLVCVKPWNVLVENGMEESTPNPPNQVVTNRKPAKDLHDHKQAEKTRHYEHWNTHNVNGVAQTEQTLPVTDNSTWSTFLVPMDSKYLLLSVHRIPQVRTLLNAGQECPFPSQPQVSPLERFFCRAHKATCRNSHAVSIIPLA